MKILNGFRYEFGGRFWFWSEFRQILGKEFLLKKSAKDLGYFNVVRGDEVGALPEAQHHDIVDRIESRGGRHLSADRPLIGTTC